AKKEVVHEDKREDIVVHQTVTALETAVNTEILVVGKTVTDLRAAVNTEILVVGKTVTDLRAAVNTEILVVGKTVTDLRAAVNTEILVVGKTVTDLRAAVNTEILVVGKTVTDLRAAVNTEILVVGETVTTLETAATTETIVGMETVAFTEVVAEKSPDIVAKKEVVHEDKREDVIVHQTVTALETAVNTEILVVGETVTALETAATTEIALETAATTETVVVGEIITKREQIENVDVEATPQTSVLSSVEEDIATDFGQKQKEDCRQTKNCGIWEKLRIPCPDICSIYNLNPERRFIEIPNSDISSSDVCDGPPQFTWFKNKCQIQDGFFITGFLTASSLTAIRFNSVPKINEQFLEIIISPDLTALHLPKPNNSLIQLIENDLVIEQTNIYSSNGYDLEFLDDNQENEKIPNNTDSNPSNTDTPVSNQESTEDNENVDGQQDLLKGMQRDLELPQSNKNIFPENLGYDHLALPLSTFGLKVYNKTTVSEKLGYQQENKRELVTPFFVYFHNKKMVFGSGIPGTTKIYPLIGIEFEHQLTQDFIEKIMDAQQNTTMPEESELAAEYSKLVYGQMLDPNYFGFWSYDNNVRITGAGQMCGYSNQFKNYNFTAINSLVESN
ncbi:hypothetical protein BB559_004638, partial [Furculomyces boomerangus]